MNHGKTKVDVTNGPGKLCQALNIDRSFTGHNLEETPVQLIERSALPYPDIGARAKIGVSKAREAQRPFHIKGNPYIYVSKGKFIIPRHSTL